jgi:hypothetical protein
VEGIFLLCTFGDLQILVTKITLISSNIMWRVFFLLCTCGALISIDSAYNDKLVDHASKVKATSLRKHCGNVLLSFHVVYFV